LPFRVLVDVAEKRSQKKGEAGNLTNSEEGDGKKKVAAGAGIK